MCSKSPPLTKLTKVATASRLHEFEASFELWKLILNLGLKYGANTQYFDEIILLVTDIVRLKEDGLSCVICANALHQKVNQG